MFSEDISSYHFPIHWFSSTLVTEKNPKHELNNPQLFGCGLVLLFLCIICVFYILILSIFIHYFFNILIFFSLFKMVVCRLYAFKAGKITTVNFIPDSK